MAQTFHERATRWRRKFLRRFEIFAADEKMDAKKESKCQQRSSNKALF